MKVAHRLGRAGILETVRGRGGGLRLSRDPAHIGLGEILRITEENYTVVECFAPSSNTCTIAGPCRLKGVLGRALKAFFAVLDEYTLADLTQKHPALVRLLTPA
jgi:Rrf2 family nitric oxide-sensitive transcriptional repressor